MGWGPGRALHSAGPRTYPVVGCRGVGTRWPLLPPSLSAPKSEPETLRRGRETKIEATEPCRPRAQPCHSCTVRLDPWVRLTFATVWTMVQALGPRSSALVNRIGCQGEL